jgi:hypothetical protein
MRIILILFVFCMACSPYRSLKTRRIEVEGKTLTAKLPAKYSRSEIKKDELGNTVQFFYYGDGTYLFFAKRADGAMFPIDTTMHVGKLQWNGDRYFKQLSDKNEYSRDVIRQDLWFGYRKASPGKQEALFDSTMNSVRVN